MTNIFPTSYDNKNLPASTDVAWGSDGVTNFNIPIDGIGDKVFLDRTTSDLVEGTNKYYTEERVAANTTVIGLGINKADKSNVLELDNTTEYTPTDDYNPATKKFVVDRGTDINGLTAETIIEDTDEIIFYDTSATNNKKMTYSNLKDNIQSTEALSTIASANIKGSALTERTRTSTSTSNVEHNVKEIMFPYIYRITGSVRLTAEAKSNGNNCAFKFYKNGTQLTNSLLTTSYQTFTFDTSVVGGDLLKCNVVVDDFETAYVKNFTLSYDEVEYNKIPVVNLD